jgi:hypothetical protein
LLEIFIIILFELFLKLQLKIILKKTAIKDKYKQGLVLCTTIKKLNRISHIKVNKARIKTHEEKNKIDEYHLELQNLLYEISYLKKEINKCLEFRYFFAQTNFIYNFLLFEINRIHLDLYMKILN